MQGARMERRPTRVRRRRSSGLGGKTAERVGNSRIRRFDRGLRQPVSMIKHLMPVVRLTGAAATSPKKATRIANVLVCILAKVCGK